MTAVPDLALSGWEGLVTFDAGVGAGFFSSYNFGVQDFWGPVQIVATSGILVNPFPHAYTGFRVQHFSDAGLYGSPSLGVRHVPRRTWIPALIKTSLGWRYLHTSTTRHSLSPYDFHPDNTHRCAISGVKLPTSSETLVMTSSASL